MKTEKTTTLSESEQAWSLLTHTIGNYFGTGVNHEGQKYEAHCHITFEIPSKLISFKMQALGMKGEIYHDEVSWIGRDITGSLCLFVNSNNHKGLTVHYFSRVEEAKDGAKKAVFRFGDLQDRMSFREEISFSIYTNYNIEHSYAWGLPGGNFEPRSAATMKKII
jgi:hypothetical protein